MPPKMFLIFIILLGMILLAADKELPRSNYTVYHYDEIISTSTLNSSECDRTKVLVEMVLRHNNKDQSHTVVCEPIDK